MPITTVPSLRRHLQWALELEHSTIPPYLCALYSIPDGRNATASLLIRSVVMEEMLHMVLAANLLNAVGGTPKVYGKHFVPKYPAYLPHSDRAFQVSLLPFSTEAIDTFMRIERPTRSDSKPKAERYHTIGQFYAAIAEAITWLEGRAQKRGQTIFTGERRRQIGPSAYYGGGGKLYKVTNLESAIDAINEITEQGEGFDHSIFDGDDQLGQMKELAHYFRFYEIRCGRRFVPTDVPKHRPTGAELFVEWDASYPMVPNPRASDFRHQPEIRRLMMDFNRRYTALLKALDDAFNGRPSAFQKAVPIMHELKYRAQALMKIPSGRGDGTTAGPSFEFVPEGPDSR